MNASVNTTRYLTSAEESAPNTRAAGSGEANVRNIMSVARRAFGANPDEEVLDDMRETVQPFILQKRREGKAPFRLVYMIGAAKVTRERNGKNSDLGLLLQMIQMKQRTDPANSMTYVYGFDSSYTEENVRRDIEEVNAALEPRREGRRRNRDRRDIIEENIREGNIIERHRGGAQASAQLQHQPFPTETFFPARYSFGPNCYFFFFNFNLSSSCLNHIPMLYDRQQHVKQQEMLLTALECAPAERSAFAYLQQLTQDLLNPGGELYIYNCAWENENEPVEGGPYRMFTLNLYFEMFPEVFAIALNDYSPNRVQSFLLSNHFRNLITNEEIIVRSTTDSGDLRLVALGPDSDFVRRRGGKRKTRRTTKKSKGTSRRWRKARMY